MVLRLHGAMGQVGSFGIRPPGDFVHVLGERLHHERGPKGPHHGTGQAPADTQHEQDGKIACSLITSHRDAGSHYSL